MISVLIPVWNRDWCLEEAIKSVKKQTYGNYEIIVADDGSTDRTPKIAGRHENVVYLRQEHSGVSSARNLALKHAKGDFIAWLDSDDLYVPEKLEKQIGYMKVHPESEIVFCLLKSFTALSQAELNPRQGLMLKPERSLSVKTNMAGALIRRSLCERFGGFDENLDYLEDSEWISRIRLGGIDLNHCIKEELYLRRVHNAQLTLTHPMASRPEILRMYSDSIRKARKKHD